MNEKNLMTLEKIKKGLKKIDSHTDKKGDSRKEKSHKSMMLSNFIESGFGKKEFYEFRKDADAVFQFVMLMKNYSFYSRLKERAVIEAVAEDLNISHNKSFVIKLVRDAKFSLSNIREYAYTDAWDTSRNILRENKDVRFFEHFDVFDDSDVIAISIAERPSNVFGVGYNTFLDKSKTEFVRAQIMLAQKKFEELHGGTTNAWDDMINKSLRHVDEVSKDWPKLQQEFIAANDQKNSRQVIKSGEISVSTSGSYIGTGR